jgi:hypothetical protein
MPSGIFDYDELVALLTELAERVDATYAGDDLLDIRIVGGAAISLAYNHDRDPTDDIDALRASKKQLVLAAAADMAHVHGLSENWVNFKVQMFAPDPMYPEPEWDVLIKVGKVRVLVPEPRMLLAMKLRAGRGQDLGDIATLLEAAGISTYDDAVATFRAFYTDDPIKGRADAFLREHLA